MIPTFTLDSSKAPTELCFLGARCNTDKSPFNPSGHRHPYTPFYSMLLAPYKNRPIRFAEIGVAGGGSVAMWAQYFTAASMFFFDRDTNFLAHAEDFALPRTSFALMDVEKADSIRASFQAMGGNLDVILDDSSHNIGHQVDIVRESIPFLKPGGILLIEDVFRNETNEAYQKVIAPIRNQLSFCAFFEMEHTNKFSPGWDNDKILMLVKA